MERCCTPQVADGNRCSSPTASLEEQSPGACCSSRSPVPRLSLTTLRSSVVEQTEASLHVCEETIGELQRQLDAARAEARDNLFFKDK